MPVSPACQAPISSPTILRRSDRFERRTFLVHSVDFQSDSKRANGTKAARSSRCIPSSNGSPLGPVANVYSGNERPHGKLLAYRPSIRVNPIYFSARTRGVREILATDFRPRAMQQIRIHASRNATDCVRHHLLLMSFRSARAIPLAPVLQGRCSSCPDTRTQRPFRLAQRNRGGPP